MLTYMLEKQQQVNTFPVTHMNHASHEALFNYTLSSNPQSRKLQSLLAACLSVNYGTRAALLQCCRLLIRLGRTAEK